MYGEYCSVGNAGKMWAIRMLERDEVDKVRRNTGYSGEYEGWGHTSEEKMLVVYPLTWGTTLLGGRVSNVQRELSH